MTLVSLSELPLREKCKVYASMIEFLQLIVGITIVIKE
jgi:hypothetical protein